MDLMDGESYNSKYAVMRKIVTGVPIFDSNVEGEVGNTAVIYVFFVMLHAKDYQKGQCFKVILKITLAQSVCDCCR